MTKAEIQLHGPEYQRLTVAEAAPMRRGTERLVVFAESAYGGPAAAIDVSPTQARKLRDFLTEWLHKVDAL